MGESRPVVKDMKEGLSSARKPDLTHVRTPLMIYTARACEYGSAKYERSNFLRVVGAEPGGPPTRADFERMRTYLRAMISHGMAVLDAMEEHQASDPKLLDVEGMKRAAYCEDTDTTPGAKVGASGLPHLCGAAASLNMVLAQAVRFGLLPADPGQPWTRVASLDAADRQLAAARAKEPGVYDVAPPAR